MVELIQRAMDQVQPLTSSGPSDRLDSTFTAQWIFLLPILYLSAVASINLGMEVLGKPSKCLDLNSTWPLKFSLNILTGVAPD